MLISVAYHGASAREHIGSSRALNMSARTASVGSFVKSELFRHTSKKESSITNCLPIRKLSKSNRKSINPPDFNLYSPFNSADQNEGSNRFHAARSEKGQNLVPKVFEGVHFLPPRASKESLLRHVSLKSHKASIHISSDSPSLNPPRFSFEPNSIDIEDPNNFRISTGRPRVALNPSFMLYPEITVVPEVDSVDARDESSVWVAVMVIGTLKRVGDFAPHSEEHSKSNYPDLATRSPGQEDKK